MKVKFWISGMFCLMLSLCLQAQHTFTIRCNIEGAKGHKFYLANSYGGWLNPNNPYSMDSLIANSDTFSFTGSFKEYKYYSLLMDTLRNFTSIIIDTGTIEIKGNATKISQNYIDKSKQNDWGYDLAALTYSIIVERNKAAQLCYEDTNHTNIPRKFYDSLTTLLMNTVEPFIKSHPNSYAAFIMMFNNVERQTKRHSMAKACLSVIFGADKKQFRRQANGL
jgi:hypothetical protein